MAKVTQKELVLNFMKFDITYHITEISEGCGIDYFSVSKVLNVLVKEGLVDRIENQNGNYVKYSPKGRVRAKLRFLTDQIKYMGEVMTKLKEDRDKKIEEWKVLKEQYDRMKQEESEE